MNKLRVLLIPVLFLCSCNGNGLPRARAAELISKQQSLPAPQTIEFGSYIKRSWSDPSWMPAACVVVGETFSEAQQRLAQWQSRGLISIGESREHQGECNYLWATTSLTSEGKKHLVRESRGAHTVRVYDLAFGEITGIQINEQFKVAEADYTLKVVNVTPFGIGVSTETRGRKAAFALFDDGWRIK